MSDEMATCGKRYLRASLGEDERLTEEVKKFPYLYDKRGKDYKDRNVTTIYWTEVATSLYILDDKDEFVILFSIHNNCCDFVSAMFLN